MTIYEAIKLYCEKTSFRGHTPGHKGKLCPFDITEIDSEFPGGLIEKAQAKAAFYYGAHEARFLTGGSSMGIKAAVMALKKDLIAPADCHRSVVEAAALARVKVIKLPLTYSEDLPNPPNAETYINALKENPNAAILVQSPDYFGRCVGFDIMRLKNLGAEIIADSAHGAHFDFCGMEKSSLASKADFCIMSAHKTLPALTMGSVMTINSDKHIADLDFALRLLGTTSPSYPILGSIEYALDYCNEHRAYYSTLIKALNDFRSAVKCLDNDDSTRLVIDASELGISGAELYAFCKKKGYVAELATNRYVVFIFTAMDSTEDINNLKEVILSYER